MMRNRAAIAGLRRSCSRASFMSATSCFRCGGAASRIAKMSLIRSGPLAGIAEPLSPTRSDSLPRRPMMSNVSLSIASNFKNWPSVIS